MIIVTGATGQLGQAITKRLLELIPAEEIGASVRDPEKAQELARQGVRVRQGNFANPPSLSHAFAGATQLLIVSSNARQYGGDPLAQHHAAIEAGRAAGVRRIFYTSHMAASSASAFPPMRDHAATEEMLRQSGLAWTALRNGFYASSGLMLMGDALKMGVIEAPADGKVSWTTHVDLAAAAANLLTNEGLYDETTPPLTGSQALDLSDLADIASELLGRPVKRQVLTDDKLQTKLAGRGAPPVVAEITLGLYRASRAGEFATVDSTLERILGRRPISMRDVIAEEISR